MTNNYTYKIKHIFPKSTGFLRKTEDVVDYQKNPYTLRINQYHMNYKLILILFSFLVSLSTGKAIGQQHRNDSLRVVLDSLSRNMPGLEQGVDLTVSSLSVQEFLRTLAETNNLNLHIDHQVNFPITNNFNDVKAKDVLLFLSKEYELDLIITGNIISIKKNNFIAPEKPAVLDIVYDSLSKHLTINLCKNKLSRVVRKITELTGVNVILAPGVEDKEMNLYLKQVNVEDAIDKIALSASGKLSNKDGFFIINAPEPSKLAEMNNNRNSMGNHSGRNNNRGSGKKSGGTFSYQATSIDNIIVKAENAAMAEVINAVSTAIGINYFIYSEIEKSVSLNLNGVNYYEFLNHIFGGSEYSYSIENGIVLIGEHNIERIRITKNLALQHRSVIELTASIPEGLKENIGITEFPELNSLILSGPPERVAELESFVKMIDKIVPVIQIEVMIIDFQTGYTVSTGINAGLAEEAVSTSGHVLPDIDMTLSSSSINNIVNSFNGLGLLNLGHVTPNFYISVKALEDKGVVKVRSTPQLSTLNGHEAVLTIGNTEYYLEETNNIIGSQNPQNVMTKAYKPIDANFNLTINPIVSGDEQITLELTVEQSDFTGRISKDAPPGKVTRKFNSLIRVKNGEMILLGGLEEKTRNDSGRGIPLLSRIPVLNWLFTSRTKESKDNKLHIFIKPTIIY